MGRFEIWHINLQNGRCATVAEIGGVLSIMVSRNITTTYIRNIHIAQKGG